MGLELTTFMTFAQIGLGAVSFFTEIIGAGNEQEAAFLQQHLDDDELLRQQKAEAFEASQEASLRSLQADKQYAAMVVAMAEVGGSGTLNEHGLAGEIGYLEGLDLAAISRTSASRVAALQAAKRSAGARFQDRFARAESRRTGAFFDFLGTTAGLVIDEQERRQERDRVDVRTPGGIPVNALTGHHAGRHHGAGGQSGTIRFRR